MGITKDIFVSKGKSIIIAADMIDAFAPILPFSSPYSWSRFSPSSVLCNIASFVPEVNANPIAINIDPRMKKINEFPMMNEIVDNNNAIFAITKAVLCPILSEMYPEGISNKNPASQPIPVYRPICCAVALGNDKKYSDSIGM